MEDLEAEDGTDDEDVDYVASDEPEVDSEYDSDEDFLDDDVRENANHQPDSSLWSKDKRIQYSKEPEMRGRPSVAQISNIVAGKY